MVIFDGIEVLRHTNEAVLGLQGPAGSVPAPPDGLGGGGGGGAMPPVDDAMVSRCVTFLMDPVSLSQSVALMRMEGFWCVRVPVSGALFMLISTPKRQSSCWSRSHEGRELFPFLESLSFWFRAVD